jgi:iron complex outermembrane receptor protein
MQSNILAAGVLSALTGLLIAPTQAQDIPTLGEIVVTATRIATPDFSAPYASEVHTRRMIEQAGAATLYDYLAQHSALQVLPSYGSRATPLIDMRGYGSEGGHQNIVVTLDGRRLNNIDMSPQLLGAIPLADIERIEITRGSGSVMFGDGATAGSIQIHTRSHDGVSLSASAGNFGALAGRLAVGASGERFRVSASADYASQNGHSDPDTTGHRDSSSSRNWRGSLEFRPVERLKLDLGATGSRIDSRYVSYLFPAEFASDPSQLGHNPWANPSDAYNRHRIDADLWRVGAEIELSRAWKAILGHSREDKRSDYSGWTSDYDTLADDAALQYRGDALDVTLGVQTFDGTRISAFDRTSKKNTGWYGQAVYRQDAWTLSAGARGERVEYDYVPGFGAALRGDHELWAWDVGVNRRLDDRSSVFASLNQAFLAPDIDRFFNFFGGAFNTFIEPARSRTLNLGYNRTLAAHRIKLTLFRANLDNEIYYEPSTGKNTNLDRSHKYGLELQDTWRMSDSLTGTLNYTWTRAVIDRESDNGGAYNGKDLPGVPRHAVIVGLTWRPDAASTLSLTHAWRGTAWSVGDFDNNAARQAVYQSTDVGYRYRTGKIEWSAAIENLFAHKNGMWIDDPFVGTAIYPVNFTRNFRVGFNARF